MAASASASGRSGGPGPNSPDRAPDCLKCRWFSVTWDPRFPRACAVFGIKSRDMPSAEVFRSTGRHCPAFQKSPRVRD